MQQTQLSPLIAMVLACAPSDPDAADCQAMACTSADASTSASGAEESTGGPSSSGVESSGMESSETGEPPSGCAAAAGVVLREVSLFQTVEVPLARDCTEIAVDTRAAPIVAGKAAMARLGVEIDPAFAATDLAASVEVEDETFTGACTPVDAAMGAIDLHVEIPAAALHADGSYVASVVQCSGSTLVSFPSSGTAALGAEETGIIRLHLVPFDVAGFVPDTSQPVLDGFRNALLAHYPVTAVDITVLPVEPDPSEGELDMDAIMMRVLQMQETAVFASGNIDPALVDIYYYGLVSGAATREEFCDNCPTGTSESGAGERAGCAAGAAFADALSESTLVHEMGHMHGLRHSPCGDPDLQDAEFPYADGLTHTEGWDFRTGEFVPADHNDMMGYCQPRWVSDYHYRKLVEWVHIANSWGDGASSARPRSAPVHCVLHE
jgi:hypothetical protein